MAKPILTLDFDGVVHHHISKYTGPDEVVDGPTPGALEAIAAYITHFQVHIFSARSHQLGGRNAMYEFCRDHFGLSITKNLGFPLNKPPSVVALDDRTITFTGTWPSVETLRAFRPWNKR